MAFNMNLLEEVSGKLPEVEYILKQMREKIPPDNML